MTEHSHFVDIGVARVDVGRHDRCGFPEVIFGPGKTPEDMVAIARMIVDRHGVLLVTRVDGGHIEAMRAAFPEAQIHEDYDNQRDTPTL